MTVTDDIALIGKGRCSHCFCYPCDDCNCPSRPPYSDDRPLCEKCDCSKVDFDAALERLVALLDTRTKALIPFTEWDFHATQHIAGLQHDGHDLRGIHTEDVDKLIAQVAAARAALAAPEKEPA